MTTSITLRVIFQPNFSNLNLGKWREKLERKLFDIFDCTAKTPINQGFSRRGFQSDHWFSSRSRYDHFDTSPYLVVFEFCTAFARPKLKCCHPKFKKNEAFARYCEETRAFATHQVMSSATFRVSPVMSCCGARNFLLACRFAKFRPLPLFLLPSSATGGGRKYPHFNTRPSILRERDALYTKMGEMSRAFCLKGREAEKDFSVFRWYGWRDQSSGESGLRGIQKIPK